jgi:S1-C subfamily serine protease
MRATGSGVVIDAGEGIILTNAHVIASADEITVAAADNRQLQAKLIASDARTDVALIKVQENMLAAIPIGNSNHLEVGDFVPGTGLELSNTKTSSRPTQRSIREIQEAP